MKEFKLTRLKEEVRKADIDFLNKKVSNKVINFHKSFPLYKETPLVNLKNLSEEIGLGGFYVKDESKRFDLNAFKVLGASYAIGSYIAGQLDMDISELPYEKMVSREVKEKLGDINFTTATDGNHGRAVAWTANQLGQKSKVFMPKGTTEERVINIRKENSDVDVYDMNYDECVKEAAKFAEENKGVLIQDTSWEGYENIPRLIMQGYTTMAREALDKMTEEGKEPTHIFLQAGVGSMATAVAGFFVNAMKDNPPIITIVEPKEANPFYKTATANDGKLHKVGGDLDSIMAGLSCGEIVTLGWPILSSYVRNYISVDGTYAAHGMRLLGNPLGKDQKIVSGESGAVTPGIVHKLMVDKNLKKEKEALKLDENSVVLCFSTEGDTDQESYRKIVWDGKYPSY